MKETAVIYPSDTLMFGEKKNCQSPHYFMDLNEGVGNDLDQIEQGCHCVAHKARNAGGSNFAFVDGSARYMRYGSTVWPLNLWAVNDTNRLALRLEALAPAPRPSASPPYFCKLGVGILPASVLGSDGCRPGGRIVRQDLAGACRRIERNEVAISGAAWPLATWPEPRPDHDRIAMSNAVASYLHFMCAALVKFRQTGAIVPSQRFLIGKMIAPVPETYSGPDHRAGRRQRRPHLAAGRPVPRGANPGLRDQSGAGAQHPA